MRKSILGSFFILLSAFIWAQSPIGVWKTIDDKSGQAKSHITIAENETGELEGIVTKILTQHTDAKCEKCNGNKKDQPIQGMMILWGMKKDGNEWSNGKILDPNSGKEYKCLLRMKDNDTLEVRGYVGISLIGRTQTWQRVK